MGRTVGAATRPKKPGEGAWTMEDEKEFLAGIGTWHKGIGRPVNEHEALRGYIAAAAPAHWNAKENEELIAFAQLQIARR
jgi:hypothetical protein